MSKESKKETIKEKVKLLLTILLLLQVIIFPCLVIRDFIVNDPNYCKKHGYSHSPCEIHVEQKEEE